MLNVKFIRDEYFSVEVQIAESCDLLATRSPAAAPPSIAPSWYALQSPCSYLRRTPLQDRGSVARVSGYADEPLIFDSGRKSVGSNRMMNEIPSAWPRQRG